MVDGGIANRIEEKVRAALSCSELILEDKSGGCGQSYLLIVISDDFANVTLLNRQR